MSDEPKKKTGINPEMMVGVSAVFVGVCALAVSLYEAQFERLDFEACYCSVVDECWTTGYSGFGTATPVDGCSRSAASFGE